MNSLLSKLEEWIKEALIGGITENFQSLFDSVNEQAGSIAAQVGQTPESFNSSIFSMIRNLSDTVIIPIAGIILTIVLCYEFIQMILEKNNMHDFDTFVIFKWIFKTFVATYILTHTFDIVMAVFDVAQYVITSSGGIIAGSLDITLAMDTLADTLADMEWYSLLGLYLESVIIGFTIKALAIGIFIVIYGRMLQIYLTVSVAAIPFATMVNHEWGQMGNNYLKGLFALAFQGFLIMVCIAIYAVLVQSITLSDNIHSAIWMCVGYTVLLFFTLFKTGSLSKSIFGAG